MFTLNDDLSIYATRGDIVFFSVGADEDGKPYKFQAGDVVRIKVFGKKNAENVVLQKDFAVTDITENVEIFLTEEDTKIGGVINKPTDYWYEVELNPYDNPQTIIGYDEDGAKVFRLFPEGDDIPPYVPNEEEVGAVDEELDLTSTRAVQNQAVARAFAKLEEGYERTHAAVADRFVTPQMFGAIGDGVADDTEAIQKALNFGKSVMLSPGIYRTTETLTIPKGCKISGDKNCIIKPESEVVFHLMEYTTLVDFVVQIASGNVLTVFEVNDDSVSNWDSVMRINIENIDVKRSSSTIPEMYTVCHFHTSEKGIYDITVRGCSFDNGVVGGYVARIYNEGDSWVSTVIFDDNNTRGFKWHYFFDKSDKEFVNHHNNSCLVTNCVAQCHEETNGFIFINVRDSVIFKNNMPWDWNISKNCPGAAYVIGSNINVSGQDVFIRRLTNSDVIRPDEVCYYDGENFSVVPYGRQDVVSYIGGEYNHALIPKYVSLARNKAICLCTTTNVNTDRRIRFYWADGNGLTYVSVSFKSRTVNVSQPIASNLVFGLSADNKKLYVYTNDGGNLPPYVGVITLPVSNTAMSIAMDTSATTNVEYTANCDCYLDTCGLDAIPSDVVELPIRLAQPAYVADEEGTIYKLTVVDDGSGKKSLSIGRAWEPANEHA